MCNVPCGTLCGGCMDDKWQKRRWMRLQEFDYASQKVYFITICTQNRKPLFCRIVGRGLDPSVQAEISMTPYGNIAEYDLLQIPEHFPQVEILNYVFMPDHLHILLALGCREVAAEGSRPLPTVPTIIGQYKSGVSRKCGRPVWQRSYYDHIIRNRHDFEEIWQYIDRNPLQWVLDGKNSK